MTSAGVSCAKENLGFRHKLVTDSKPLPAHIGKDFQWVINQRASIAITQDTERAGEGKTAVLRYRSPFPLIHDQHVGLLLRGQLNGFPFAAIKGGYQFGVGRATEGVNP
jgi:hypothetical protein